MSTFTVDITGDGPQSRLVLTGELDIAAADEVLAAGTTGLSGDSHTLVIDVSGVSFIDSSGLGTFVKLLAIADESGKTVTVVNPSESVRRILQLTGMAGVFDPAPPVDDASPGENR